MANSIGGNVLTPGSSGSSVASGVVTPQPVAGSTLLAFIGFQVDAGTDVSTVTDNASGNMWTRVGTRVDGSGGDGARLTCFRAINVATVASFVVTANFNGSVGSPTIQIVEIKGAHATTPIGVSGGTDNVNAPTSAGGLAMGSLGTPSQNDHMVVAFTFSLQGVDNIDVTGGYTELSTNFAPSTNTMYLLQTTAAAVSPAWTQDLTNADFVSFAVSIRPADAGGPVALAGVIRAGLLRLPGGYLLRRLPFIKIYFEAA